MLPPKRDDQETYEAALSHDVCGVTLIGAGTCDDARNDKIRPEGLERISTTTYSIKGLCKSRGTGAAKSDAVDATLQELIEAWSELPEAVRGAILVMVRAAVPR